MSGGQCAACSSKQGKRLQRSAITTSHEETVPALVHEVLRGPGQPLDGSTRSLMESRLGHDFSRVRAHVGSSSSNSGARLPQKSGGDLEIGPIGDSFEQEADRIAARVERPSEAQSETRRASGRTATAEQTVSAEQAVSAARGYDLSRVRVHTDARAAESARSLGAAAYTVGHDVVFGSGQYAPATHVGRALLAHELTHVAQQERGGSGGALQGKVLQRKGGTVGGFFSNIGNSIKSFFGGEVKYDEETLQAYLRVLDQTGEIEDDYDSDDKARAVVNAWRLGGSPYVLTAQRKSLLIREMQKGFTGDDDELAILEILERSYNFELSHIFGAGGVVVKDLNSDFHGDEWDRLQDFYGRRFAGGMEEMLKGNIKPRGLPIGFGEAMPIPGNWMTEDLPGAQTQWNVACVLGILCTEDKGVVAQLPGLTVQKADTVTEVYWEFDGTTWNMKTRERAAFSNAADKIIGLKKSTDCAGAAENIIHEVRHQNQPSTWTKAEKERDAYTFAEDWSIKRGIPGWSSFRTTDPNTKQEVPDTAAIEKYVADRYSGATATPGEVVTGHTADGLAEIEHPDGTPGTRPPIKGDSHQDVDKTRANLQNLPKVDPALWVCPEKKKTK